MKNYLQNILNLFTKVNRNSSSPDSLFLGRVALLCALALLITSLITKVIVNYRFDKQQLRCFKTLTPQASKYTLLKDSSLKNNTVYCGQNEKDEFIGYIIKVASRSNNGIIKLLVGITEDKVTSVILLSNNEPPGFGDRLNSARSLPGRMFSFLGQFQNKSIYDMYKVNEDISPVTGAANSSQTVADGVKEAIILYKKLEEKRWQTHP